MSSPVEVRVAREDDLPGVLALERATVDAPHWTHRAYRGYFTDATPALRRRALFVAVWEEVVQGFAAVTLVAEEAELESIAVAETERRSGLGTELLRAAETWARHYGAHTLLLEVRSANTQAQAFYAARGFTREGLRRGYYERPEDDAVLMRLKFFDAAASAPSPRADVGREL